MNARWALAPLFALVVLWSAPARSHSWVISSVIGNIDASTLSCADGLCRARLKPSVWMDVERGERLDRDDVRSVHFELGRVRAPVDISDETSLRAFLKRVATGPVRIGGNVDNFDDDGKLDLRAEWIAPSPSSFDADLIPFAGCGLPPWSPDQLASCAPKHPRQLPVQLDAVLEGPPHTAPRGHLGTVTLQHAKPVKAGPLYQDNPWALVLSGALIRRGKHAVSLRELKPGTKLRVAGRWELPRPVLRKGKRVYPCRHDRCWPRLVLSHLVVRK